MQTKQLKLNEQDLQHYQQIEDSIAHWSVEHTKAQLQADRLKGAVNSMYEGRMQLMNGAMKAAGMNPAHVHQVHVNPEDGTVNVMYDEATPNPASDPSEGGAVSPTADPSGP